MSEPQMPGRPRDAGRDRGPGREVTERHDDGTRTYRNIVTLPDGSEHASILATFSPRSG